jgi:hypothetical protein
LAALGRAWRIARAGPLARTGLWPRENRDAIEQLLSRSPEAQARAALKARIRLLYETVNRTWVEEARVYRVIRA